MTLPARQSSRQSSGIALVVHDRVQQGHKLHLIPDNMHWPVLRAGDWAMVDTEWTEIDFGQLYLVGQSHGSRVWQINPEPESSRLGRLKFTGEDIRCGWLSPINRPHSREELDQILEDSKEMATPGTIPVLPLYLSDGPIRLDALQEWIEGRVVGVYEGAALIAGLRHETLRIRRSADRRRQRAYVRPRHPHGRMAAHRSRG